MFGVDEGCRKTVVTSGEALVAVSVKDSKEMDARGVTVEARDGFVEEETSELDDIAMYKDTANCSGEGASKVWFVGFEQSTLEPQQQDHKLLVSLKTISCAVTFAAQIGQIYCPSRFVDLRELTAFL